MNPRRFISPPPDVDECAQEIRHLIEQLETAARESVESMPATAKAEVRQLLQSVMQQFNPAPAAADVRKEETGGSMPVVGRLYAPIGTVQVQTGKGIRLVIDEHSHASEDLISAVLSLNDDIQRGIPLTTFHEEAHELSNPPDSADIEALSENLAIRTAGKVLFSPYSEGVTRLSESG
jgi:hypothetical protein